MMGWSTSRLVVVAILSFCILVSVHQTTEFYSRYYDSPDGNFTRMAADAPIVEKKKNESKISVDPFQDKRAVVLISMGGETVSSMNMVERFVWSLRRIGKFDGWIVLITDANESRYANLTVREDLTADEKFLVMRPAKNKFAKITSHRRFTQTKSMNAKIFKTYILEYASLEASLDHIELFYYLDVDIVFGNTIQSFFEGVESDYGIGRQSSANASTVYFFEGNGSKQIQGGQMILERNRSQACLKRWRTLMRKSRKERYIKDQMFLTMMLEEQADRENATESTITTTTKDCEIVRMKQKPEWILFPELSDIQNRTDSIRASNATRERPTYPPLLHFRNSAHVMKDVEEDVLQIYMKDILGLDHHQEDPFGISGKMIMGRKMKKDSPPDEQK